MEYSKRLGLFAFAVVAFVLATIGCDTFAADQRQVIARDAQWTITAVGDLEASGRSFGVNRVRFEAARDGVRYADGDLYEAGPHDHPFAFRFNSREWVAQNALRLAHVTPAHLENVELLVRNESSTTIKYLRVRTDELFLLLELPPRAFVTLPTRRWGDITKITVHGMFDSGTSFDASSKGFQEAARRLKMVIRSDGVDMNEAR